MKIKLEEFNNCFPSEIKEILNKYNYEVLDIERDYWQNDNDTLVIKINKTNITSLLGIITKIDSSDEINYIIRDKEFILRFWWD